MNHAPHPFTLRQLQYLVAVDETRSFSQAAARCRVAQPSLSAQVALVEDALGARLFERSRRNVVVTPMGERLLPRIRELLAQADELSQAAAQARDPLAGTLRLGIIPTISPYLLPHLAPALRRAFPRLTAAWMEDRTTVLVDSLRRGRLDAALLALEADVGDVERAVIARDPFVIAAARGHPLVTPHAPATPAMLRELDMLLLDEGHCLRDQALDVCAAVRTREVEFRATSLATLVHMVASGAGITLLPALALPTETLRAAITTRRFVDPAPARTIALIWRPHSPLRPACEALADVIRAAYPSPRPALSQGRARSR